MYISPSHPNEYRDTGMKTDVIYIIKVQDTECGNGNKIIYMPRGTKISDVTEE